MTAPMADLLISWYPGPTWVLWVLGLCCLCTHPKLLRATQFAAVAIAALMAAAIVHAHTTDAHGGLGYWALTQLVLSVWPAETFAPPPVLASSEKEIWNAWLESVPSAERQPREPQPIPELDIDTLLAADGSAKAVNLDLSRPVLLRGALNKSASNAANWDLAWLASPPHGEMVVP